MKIKKCNKENLPVYKLIILFKSILPNINIDGNETLYETMMDLCRSSGATDI